MLNEVDNVGGVPGVEGGRVEGVAIVPDDEAGAEGDPDGGRGGGSEEARASSDGRTNWPGRPCCPVSSAGGELEMGALKAHNISKKRVDPLSAQEPLGSDPFEPFLLLGHAAPLRKTQ